MAAYAVVDKIIRGQPTEVLAEAETYLETLDSTNNPLYLIQCVGDNNYVTLLIIHGG